MPEPGGGRKPDADQGSAITADAKTKSENLRIRIISAAVLIPLVIVDVYLGGWAFAAMVIATVVVTAYEYVSLVPERRRRWLRLPLLVSGLVVALLAAAGEWLAAIAMTAVAAIAVPAVLRMVGGPFRYAAFGALYLLLPAIALLFLRADPAYGFAVIVWLLAVVWATDTGAFAAGSAIGGPKLARSISPNKTWAGLLGGMAAAAAASVAAGLAFGTAAGLPLAVLGAFTAVVAQAGDLLESALKRRAGVKDSGTLIPGHGGLLDRIDGLITAAVAVALVGLVRGGLHHPGEGVLVWP